MRRFEVVLARSFLICLLFAPGALLASDRSATNIRHYWASKRYQTNAFPDVWRPERLPQPPIDFEVLKKEKYLEVLGPVSRFVARFGLPSRYLKARKKEDGDFLIYDLPSGTAIALYVSTPPNGGIYAAVIVDSAGEVTRLIK